MKKKELDTKIDKIRLDICTDTHKRKPTLEQLRYMNSMINVALVRQSARYLVVGYIVGRLITTTYALSRHEVSCIIDELKGEDGRISEDGQIFIKAVEVTVKECPLPV